MPQLSSRQVLPAFPQCCKSLLPVRPLPVRVPKHARPSDASAAPRPGLTLTVGNKAEPDSEGLADPAPS